MPALIDLRRRIKSVQNTQQITQAMKSVATAKFRKAQKTVLESRPFWHNFPDLTGKMTNWVREETHPLLQKREEKKVLGIVITSDKGLCGAFNSNLLEEASSFFEEKSSRSHIRLIFPVLSKGNALPPRLLTRLSVVSDYWPGRPYCSTDSPRLPDLCQRVPALVPIGLTLMHQACYTTKVWVQYKRQAEPFTDGFLLRPGQVT